MTSKEAAEATQRGWEELELWGRDPELNELDTLMWRTERHPTDSWTGVVVETFDDNPTWEVYRDGAVRALTLVPRFRQRVVDPLLTVGPPEWELDLEIDLAYHVRKDRLNDLGSTAQVL